MSDFVSNFVRACLPLSLCVASGLLSESTYARTKAEYPYFAALTDPCAVFLGPAMSAEERVAELYAKLLQQYREGVGSEAEYLEFLSRALSENNYYVLPTSHSGMGTLQVYLKQIEGIESRGALPNGEKVSREEIRVQVRKHLEKEQALARGTQKVVDDALREVKVPRALMRVLEGHRAEVTSVQVSADFTRAVSASGDGELIYWDLEKGKLLHRLEGHEEWVKSVQVSADFKYALSASTDGTLIYWDLEKGKLLKRLEGHTKGVNSVWMSADSTRGVSASSDGTLIVWNLEVKKRGFLSWRPRILLRQLRGHEKEVISVQVSTDSTCAVSGSYDGTLIYWDLEKGKLLKRLAGHTKGVNAVRMSADSTRALSASTDGTVIYWDLEDGKLLQRLEGHTGSVTSVQVSTDSTRAVSGSYDGTVIYWNLENGQLLKRLEGHTKAVLSLQVTANFKYAVSTSIDGTLIVWDLEAGRLLYRLEGHTGSVTAVRMSADNKRAVSVSTDGTLIDWNLSILGEIP